VPHTSRDYEFTQQAITLPKPTTGLIRQWSVKAYDHWRIARKASDQVEDLRVSRHRKRLDVIRPLPATMQHDDACFAGTRRSGQIDAC